MELQSRTNGYSEVKQNYAQKQQQNGAEIRGDRSNHCSSFLTNTVGCLTGASILLVGCYTASLAYDFNSDIVSQTAALPLIGSCYYLGNNLFCASLKNIIQYNVLHKAG